MKKSELTETIEEIIAEILGEAGLFTLKNPADSNKGLAQTLDPDDSTEKSSQFLSKYKKVAESEDDGIQTLRRKLSQILKRNGGKTTPEIKKLADEIKSHPKYKGDISESEDDEMDTPEKEPTKSELRKNAGAAKIKDELANVTKEMKELAKEYSKAESAKKEKIKDKLKNLTKAKKDLEARLEKSL